MADQKQLNTAEARQGVTLHRMRYVLVFGVLGAGLALVIAWLIFGR